MCNRKLKSMKSASNIKMLLHVALLAGTQPTIGVVVEQIQCKKVDASGKYFPIVMASAYMLLKEIHVPHTTNWQDVIDDVLCAYHV